jgi:hypothetical protein
VWSDDPGSGKAAAQRAAAAELVCIGHEVRTGGYVKPWNGTLNELLDDDWYRSGRGPDN